MRVPREILRDVIRVQAYSGSGARGPVFGDESEVRASVQRTAREVVDSHGATVTSDTMAVIRPEDGPVRPESRVVARGTQYRVAACYAMPDERRPSHYELALVRYAWVDAGVGSGGS